MLTNGSGWSHFFAFACFYYHELVPGPGVGRRGKGRDRLKLLVLPWLIILGTAGPYCAVYAATLLLSYGFCMVMDRRKRKDCPGRRGRVPGYAVSGLYGLRPAAPSSVYAEQFHGGGGTRGSHRDVPWARYWLKIPHSPIRFLLKSFCGSPGGREELERFMENGLLSNRMCYVLGLFVVCGYLMALWINFPVPTVWRGPLCL